MMKIVVLGLETAEQNDQTKVDELVMSVLTLEEAERIDGGDKESGSTHTIERLALGVGVFKQMWDDGQTFEAIHEAAQYASLYWVFGEETADKILFGDDDEEAATVELPKPSGSGPSTESPELSEKTEPSGDIGSLPSSGSSSTKRKKPAKKTASPGKTLPKTGT